MQTGSGIVKMWRQTQWPPFLAHSVLLHFA